MSLLDLPIEESFPTLLEPFSTLTESSTFKVKVLYDFQGETNSGELSITTGETLTITRTDVGEGWWEGANSTGASGLFPEAYVERITAVDDIGPSVAPPPLPPDYDVHDPNSGGGGGGWKKPDDDWGNQVWGMPSSTEETSKGNDDYQGYDQDEWDSDFDDPSEMPPPTTNPSQGGRNSAQNLGVTKNGNVGGSNSDLSLNNKKGPVVSFTSFNRFSFFVKSGTENYILGKSNLKVDDSELVSVVDIGDHQFCWNNQNQPFNCAIASPKKESKLHGLKSFIAYRITPSFSGIPVSRRYKHFDWLHERLTEKFAIIPIPPLPDKQIQGRYEDEFIDHRMIQLQSFVNRVCRHPILSQSKVWQHFLTCTDDKKWKTGKRTAERDPLVGGNFLLSVVTPEFPIDSDFLDRQVEYFTKFSSYFDSAVKNMHKVAIDQSQKSQNLYKREFQTIGKAFIQLGQAMEQDPTTNSTGLNNAITCTGETYEEIANLLGEQPRNDWDHLSFTMYDYKGMLMGWPGILQMHSGAMGKRKEFEKLQSEGKVSNNEVNEIVSRTDVLSYSLLAEINTFHQQRIKDIKIAHQKFLQEQITYYKQVTGKLEAALQEYDNC
ncbi:sorting nexin lst-4 isoform X2 [Lepeophtheirus salmonis]|uniref:sorting nexin lst-4 isoform X2 n=1 Tax=Lepeophtheirus salmonis TaxID=72036 RepID=UPI001AE46437|nr:sorting nexin lst-4-like isoform X2 [Lepeophtheirus salmonis]